MSNMDDFNRCTALVLAKLYDEFPKAIGNLRAADLEENLSESELDNFCASLQFLVDEGFISCKSVGRNALFLADARLTSKGLTVLKSIPDAISGAEAISFADKIKTVIHDGSKQALNGVISQTIAAFVKLLLA